MRRSDRLGIRTIRIRLVACRFHQLHPYQLTPSRTWALTLGNSLMLQVWLLSVIPSWRGIRWSHQLTSISSIEHRPRLYFIQEVCIHHKLVHPSKHCWQTFLQLNVHHHYHRCPPNHHPNICRCQWVWRCRFRHRSPQQIQTNRPHQLRWLLSMFHHRFRTTIRLKWQQVALHPRLKIGVAHRSLLYGSKLVSMKCDRKWWDKTDTTLWVTKFLASELIRTNFNLKILNPLSLNVSSRSLQDCCCQS